MVARCSRPRYAVLQRGTLRRRADAQSPCSCHERVGWRRRCPLRYRAPKVIPLSASFLKGGIHKRVAEPPSGKVGDYAETTARPHHLFELASSAHRQDSRETRLSSEERKKAPPPLQRRRDRRARRPPRHGP